MKDTMRKLLFLFLLLITIIGVSSFGEQNEPIKKYAEFYFSNGEIYYKGTIIEKENRIEKVNDIFNHYCDSLITHKIIPSNCRYLHYLLIIDTTEISKNISSFVYKFKENILRPYAYLVTNKPNDSLYTEIGFPYPDEVKSHFKKTTKSKSWNIDLISVGNNVINYKNEKLNYDRLAEIIDSLFKEKNLIYIQPKENSKFFETLNAYRFCEERFKNLRDQKSIELFGLNYENAKLKAKKDDAFLEYKFHEFRKEYAVKIKLDFLYEFEEDTATNTW